MLFDGLGDTYLNTKTLPYANKLSKIAERIANECSKGTMEKSDASVGANIAGASAYPVVRSGDPGKQSPFTSYCS